MSEDYKSLYRVTAQTTIDAPDKNTSLHNDLCYFASKKGVKVEYGDKFSLDNDVIFLDNKEALPDRTLFLLSSTKNFEPVLRVRDYIADSFKTSVEIAKNRVLTKLCLKDNNVPTPDFKISVPLDFPFVIKREDSLDHNSDNHMVYSDEDFDREIRFSTSETFLCEKYIEKAYPIEYRVHCYFYQPIACDLLLGDVKHKLQTITSRTFIPVYPKRFDSAVGLVPYFQIDFNPIKGRTVNLIWKDLSESQKDMLKASRTEEYCMLYTKPDIFQMYLPATSKVLLLAVQAAKALRLGSCSVDLIKDTQGNTYVLDVNPGIENLLYYLYDESSDSRLIFNRLWDLGAFSNPK